ncbi:hypothetical protein GCM10010145_38810 [Streptomyces ruber]|uniref:Uncharacterized protein n=2 Tax=Streptomyces TaxID=1883 RepID=A0A918BFK9_9ACTN|nr:hypothetical protein [Streptomyces ruber]GGQ65162.1 hypothetical protein GCM10010145_38810 [Streptomyces ruber]
MAGDIRTGRDTQVGGFGPIKDTDTAPDTRRQGTVPGHQDPQTRTHAQAQTHAPAQAQTHAQAQAQTQTHAPVTGTQGSAGRTETPGQQGHAKHAAHAGQASTAGGPGTTAATAHTTGSHVTGSHTTGSHTTGSHVPLLAHGESDTYAQRLHHTVSGFVDGPRDAVEDADRLLQEITTRFTEAVTERRRTLRASWQANGEGGTPSNDTEQLRLALRDYRELAERLLKV